MSNAYRSGPHAGHDYKGMYTDKASRRNSKIHKAMKGVASFELLDEVRREDEARRLVAKLKEGQR